MEDLLLSQKQYFALLRRLDEINQDVTSIKIKSEPDTNYIKNSDLMALLGVSKRTAQRWRLNGRLPFVKIGRKLYYRTDEVMNCFRVLPGDAIETRHSPPLGELAIQMECERCPLFVILNE